MQVCLRSGEHDKIGAETSMECEIQKQLDPPPQYEEDLGAAILGKLALLQTW